MALAPMLFMGHYYMVREVGDGEIDEDSPDFGALRERFQWCLEHHGEMDLNRFINFVTLRNWLDHDGDSEADGILSPSIRALVQLWCDDGSPDDEGMWHAVHHRLFMFARNVVAPRDMGAATYIVEHIHEFWVEQCDEPVEGVLKYIMSDKIEDWQPFFDANDEDWLEDIRAFFGEGPDDDNDNEITPSMAVLTI